MARLTSNTRPLAANDMDPAAGHVAMMCSISVNLIKAQTVFSLHYGHSATIRACHRQLNGKHCVIRRM